MVNYDSEMPLPVSGPCRGLAFDGCRTYLTARCACAVTVLDRDGCLIETVRTRRSYTALCYDFRRGCFWALSDDAPAALFQLDRCLREIDRLCLERPAEVIAACCDSGCLLTAWGDQLREVDPDSGESTLLCRTRGLILTVVCLPPYLLVRVLRCGAVYFVLLSRDGRVLEEERDRAALASAAWLPDPCTGQLLALTHKHGCYPRLLRFCLDPEIRETLCPCSADLCRDCCEEDGCQDLLRSVARVECGIARILDAEGEKLQKAVELSSSPCELLRVNDSVQRTVLRVTQLERLLLAKLETARDCGCGDCGCEEHGDTP